MNYKTKKFIDFLGTKPDTYHIYVRIDDRKEHKVSGIPARNIKFVRGSDGQAQLYVSVNPCRMMAEKPKISDVTHWTCEYIDLDCERPDHSVPATSIELAGLGVEIERVNNWLDIEGFLPGYFDRTGNGYRWLLPVPSMDLRDISAESVMKLNEQKKEFLRIIKRETDTNIDTGVGELSRITGIPGTMNVKARDDRDRRREPFRGCDRIEDLNLRDYILNIEIIEDEYIPSVADWAGDAGQILEVILTQDIGLKTMIDKASTLGEGMRSNYDYAIAQRLHSWEVSMSDAMDIIRQFGSSKARTRKDNYVKITVLGAYMIN